MRLQVPGMRLQVPGMRLQVPGMRLQVPGMRLQVPGMRLQVPGMRFRPPECLIHSRGAMPCSSSSSPVIMPVALNCNVATRSTPLGAPIFGLVKAL